jgi:hypothetical protein
MAYATDARQTLKEIKALKGKIKLAFQRIGEATSLVLLALGVVYSFAPEPKPALSHWYTNYHMLQKQFHQGIRG